MLFEFKTIHYEKDYTYIKARQYTWLVFLYCCILNSLYSIMTGKRKRIRAGINRLLVAVTDDDRFLATSKQLFTATTRKSKKKSSQDVLLAIRADMCLIV